MPALVPYFFVLCSFSEEPMPALVPYFFVLCCYIVIITEKPERGSLMAPLFGCNLKICSI